MSLALTHLSGFGARRAPVPAVITSLGTDTGTPPAAWLDSVLTGSDIGAFAQYYGKDFSANKNVTQLKIYGATSRGTCTNPATGTAYLEYSDDGVVWVSAANSGAIANCDQADWVATVTYNGTSHRYWQWKVTNTAGDSNMYLAESQWTGY